MQLYKLDFPNGKSYIGITSKTAQERFNQHCCKSKNKNPCQLAIHKYGKENIIINVLAECNDWELLCLAEQEAIEKFNTFKPSGYNLTKGGEGVFGLKWDDLSNHRNLRPFSDETRLKMSISASNKSKNHRNKISQANKIAQSTIEAKERQRKIAIAQRKKQREAKEQKEKELASHKATIRTKRLLREMADSFK